MLAQYLLPQTMSRQDGIGERFAIDTKVVHLTLGITRIIAQESLEVSVRGSADGKFWRTLITFPQKCYCGTYPMLLDLGHVKPAVKYLRAEWKMGRWIRDESAPLFEFYLLAGELSEVAANAGR